MSQMIRVTAVPLAGIDDGFTIECSDCGPLCVASEVDTNDECLDHLEEVHGVDTSQYR